MKSGLDATPLFLQVDMLSQNLTTGSLSIYLFCTNYKHKIVLILIFRTRRPFQVRNLYKARKSRVTRTHNVYLSCFLLAVKYKSIRFYLYLKCLTWMVLGSSGGSGSMGMVGCSGGCVGVVRSKS